MQIPDFRPFINGLPDRNEDFLTKHINLWNTAVPIKIKKYISEKKWILRKIMRDKESYNLIAPMNSGKTYSLIKYALDHNIRMVMAMPLQILVRQKMDEFEKMPEYKDKIISTHYKLVKNRPTLSLTNEQFREKIESGVTVILAVYDSIPKVFSRFKDPDKSILYDDELQEVLSKFILVIDEAHNLVTQYDFRHKAIWDLSFLRHFFKKVIYLTGTPDFAIYNDHQTLVYEQLQPKERIVYTLFFYEVYQNPLYFLYNLLLNKKYSGKVIIMIDNTYHLRALEKLLLKNLLDNDYERIKILHSLKKEDSEFLHLIEQEKISDKVQYILTTRVLSDGINIKNENIDAVIFVDEPDFLLKRQFVARFRRGIRCDVYDFIQTITQVDLQYITSDYKDLFLSRLSAVSSLALNMNRHKYFKNLSAININQIKPNPLDVDGLGYSLSYDVFFEFPEGIGYSIMKDFHYYIYSNPLLYVPYLHDVAKYNYETTDGDDYILKHPTSISRKKFEAEIIRVMDDIDITNIANVRANIIPTTLHFFPRLKEHELIDNVIKNDVSKLNATGIKSNFDILRPEVKTIIQKSKEMIKDGFTKEVIELIAKNIPQTSKDPLNKRIDNDLFYSALVSTVQHRINFEIARKYDLDDKLLKREVELKKFLYIKEIDKLFSSGIRIKHASLMKLIRALARASKNDASYIKKDLLNSYGDYHIYTNKAYLTMDQAYTKEEFLKKISGLTEFQGFNKVFYESGFDRMIDLQMKRILSEITNRYKKQRQDVPRDISELLGIVELRSRITEQTPALQREFASLAEE